MTIKSLRRAVAGLVAEDRPAFKHVDAAPAASSLQRRWNA